MHHDYLDGVADVRLEVVAPFLGEHDHAVSPAEELADLGPVGIVAPLQERGELAVVLMENELGSSCMSDFGDLIFAL